MVIVLGSCTEHYYYESELLVRVEGLLSGNPREGIIVQLFETQLDAEQLIHPISPAVATDPYGVVLFYGLKPGFEYFVRVDGVLFTKVRDTRILRSGANDCVIKLL